MGQLQGQAQVGDMMHGEGWPLRAASGKPAWEGSELTQEKARLQGQMTEIENPKFWEPRKVEKGDYWVQKANGKR